MPYFARFNFMGQGNITLVEGVDLTAGAGNDEIGLALALQLDSDLDQATDAFQAVSLGTDSIVLNTIRKPATLQP